MQKPSPVHRLLTLAALPAAAAPNNITDLGTLRSDNSGSSGALAISADGSVVVGHLNEESSTDTRAIVWSGSGWQTKTDLGTLKADNSGDSEATAVSGDGLVVGGTARNDNGDSRGIIWSGSNWTTKTELGTLKADNSGYSWVQALSRDGSVAVGNASYDPYPLLYRPIVWSGSNWATKTELGTLDSDGIIGSAYAVSDDGSIVVGSISTDSATNRAIVWSGSGWATKTDLGTLSSDNSGWSFANAVSRDGSVVGGQADNDNGESHATIWSGSNWSTKTDLGTLKSDNSGSSEVKGLSADGKFAVGWAINDNNASRAAVWNLRSFNIRPTDTANTRASLSLLSADTASLLAQRARAAENLLGGCRADGGKFCYSAGYRRDIGHGASSRGADFAFGYGISDNFDAAVSLAVPARAEENGSHRLKSGVGIGLSARLHNGAGWYAVPAAAFETDKTRIRRPIWTVRKAPRTPSAPKAAHTA